MTVAGTFDTVNQFGVRKALLANHRVRSPPERRLARARLLPVEHENDRGKAAAVGQVAQPLHAIAAGPRLAEQRRIVALGQELGGIGPRSAGA